MKRMKKTSPEQLKIEGIKCTRSGRPMVLNGQTWDTYIPDTDGRDDEDPVLACIWERSRESGRIIQTRGED